MIGDALSDCIATIEAYERDTPETYDEHRDLLADLKEVMCGVDEIVSAPPIDEKDNRRIVELMDAEKRDRWRLTCEAQIARWIGRLRLLGPITAQHIVEIVEAAIERQEAALEKEAEDSP